jgi:cell division septal protein FtsQ
MIFLSALPWLPFSSDFIFGPADEIRLFDNNIRTIDIFAELSGTLSLPDLKGLEFNQLMILSALQLMKALFLTKNLKIKLKLFVKLQVAL